MRKNKDNHVLRSSKYTQRENNIKKGDDIFSYNKSLNNCYSQKNIKTIDFSKMKPHSLDNLTNTNINKNPPICYYEPNYDAFTKKKYVIFNANELDKKLKKKNILKKIWSSYNVSKEYLSIDNDKLNEGVNKNLYNIYLRNNIKV